MLTALVTNNDKKQVIHTYSLRSKANPSRIPTSPSQPPTSPSQPSSHQPIIIPSGIPTILPVVMNVLPGTLIIPPENLDITFNVNYVGYRTDQNEKLELGFCKEIQIERRHVNKLNSKKNTNKWF